MNENVFINNKAKRSEQRGASVSANMVTPFGCLQQLYLALVGCWKKAWLQIVKQGDVLPSAVIKTQQTEMNLKLCPFKTNKAFY